MTGTRTGTEARPSLAAPKPSPVGAAPLFLAFLRLGATAFGGPAMIAYMRELAVSRKRWLTEETFRDGVALCQSIPGATAMQMAAYVGLQAGGPRGALAAFAGFGLPAFLFMIALSAIYGPAHELRTVTTLFSGLQVVVVALVTNAALGFGLSSLRRGRDFLIAAVAGLFLGCYGNPIVAIVACGVLGIVMHRAGASPADTTGAPPPAEHAAWTRRALYAALGAIPVVGALWLVSRTLFALAAVMFKIDLFAFGGGFASVPLMLHEIVEARHWMDGRTFMDGIALGQITPGPIVITATFVGYRLAGLAGAVVATAGIFTPSFLMVLGMAPFFRRLQRSAVFRRAVRGVLASFVGLLFAAAWHFGMAIEWRWPSALLALAAFAALRLKVDILWVVLVCALGAILFL